MSMLDDLERRGVNVNEGVSRLMNNRDIYEKLLKKLPEAISAQNVPAQFESGDVQKMITATHTIKGVTGNLSVTPLYTAYTEIVDLLRADKISEAKALYEQTVPVQELLLQIINSN